MTDENLLLMVALHYAKYNLQEMNEDSCCKWIIAILQLDTLAMVIIYEYWLNELSSK